MPIAGILLLMISFLIMILMTSVVFNGSFVNNRNFVNAYAASDNKTAPRSTYALEGPDSVNISNETIMKQLLSSNKPDDIVTLAYICGYPLVRAEVTKDYMTNPRVSGFGPVNQFHPVTETCKCFKEVVRPIADTLYDQAWLDLKQGPLGNISLSFCSQCAFGICV